MSYSVKKKWLKSIIYCTGLFSKMFLENYLVMATVKSTHQYGASIKIEFYLLFLNIIILPCKGYRSCNVHFFFVLLNCNRGSKTFLNFSLGFIN